MWLLYAGGSITLIRMAGRSMVSNITGPLILEPDQLTCFGMEHQEALKTFLYQHGNRGRIRFQPCKATGAEAGISGRVVLDITDSGEIRRRRPSAWPRRPGIRRRCAATSAPRHWRTFRVSG